MEEELTTKKYYRIIPVKIKDNKIVRVKEIPAFESKNLRKALLNKSNISTSTEQTAATNNIINTNTNNQQNEIKEQNEQKEQKEQQISPIERLTNILVERYEKILRRMKRGSEMIGTVEENIGEYPNLDPFCLVSTGHSQSYISNTKKVYFRKTDENSAVYKILNSNLFLTIYNKAPPQKKYFRKSEIAKFIQIQKRFKGLCIREIERSVDRLRVRDSLLEIMLLLTGKAYDHAVKKKVFTELKKEFHDPFNNINDELRFEDKLQFKLPNRFYNFSNINQLSPQE